MRQSSIEWLNSNNETICSMLLLDKIPQSIYEQLINCFSMNFERAKEMHKKECFSFYEKGADDEFNGVSNNAFEYYKEKFGIGDE